MTTATIESAPRRRLLSDDGTAQNWRTPVSATLDRETLVTAYGAHRAAAHLVAYRILGDGPEAEDVVEEAFLKLWTGATQFDPARGSMRGLILTITRHTSIDVIRKRARRLRTESAYCADATYVTDGPERATERADEARRVRHALRSLPQEQRRTIELAYFSGFTRREIGASGAVPVGTVKSRMRLGMKKLALSLADYSPVTSNALAARRDPRCGDERLSRTAAIRASSPVAACSR